MLLPLFRLATRQPQLLADHLEAYSGLVASELGTVATQWKHSATYRVLGYVALGVATLLGAIALMLWAVVPVDAMNQPWLLVMVPLAPALVGVLALIKSATGPRSPAFAALRRQWAADAEMLREVNTS